MDGTTVFAGTQPHSQESDIFSSGKLFKRMLGKFVQPNFLMGSFSDKCTVFLPSPRVSLEQLNCALYIIGRELCLSNFLVNK